MTLHRLTEKPAPVLTAALAEFERSFTYPLGPLDSFSISHGDDYTRFFRSMGPACLYAAAADGKIAGTLVQVTRTVVCRDGRCLPAAYLCDAKIAPWHRGGLVLVRLMEAACADILRAGIGFAYAVVMDGSPSPDRYTGRLGVPAFTRLADLTVLCCDTAAAAEMHALSPHTWNNDLIRVAGGCAADRSEMPELLLEANGAAGILSDTRRGKRLFRSDGSEILNAHLRLESVASAQAAGALLRRASAAAADLGYTGLFCALPAENAQSLATATGITTAGAGLYGCGFSRGGAWQVDSCEI